MAQAAKERANRGLGNNRLVDLSDPLTVAKLSSQLVRGLWWHFLSQSKL